jgi:hypothetical protein
MNSPTSISIMRPSLRATPASFSPAPGPGGTSPGSTPRPHAASGDKAGATCKSKRPSKPTPTLC